MLLREIAGEYVLVPVWGDTVDFNGVVMLNDVSAFIWENLEKVSDARALTELITDEFEVEHDVAYSDVCEFLDNLRQSGLIE